MKQQEHFGYGSINKLADLLKGYTPNHIFLVTGRYSYVKCGAKTALSTLLKDYNTTHFFDFDLNPKIEGVEKGISLYRKKKCDLTIAIGGGSVLDIAKSVNILAANKDEPRDYIQQAEKMKQMEAGNPLIAIPTTSGTGSEATAFSVVYVNKNKYSLEHEGMLPNAAIIDPHFTLNLPPYITACTGADALCQAIESYWSVKSTEKSQSYAKEAIGLIFGSLEKAVNNPDQQSREDMAKGAYLAGKAINLSKTTACHAISYPMTSYFDAPHGQAVIITLSSMFEYISQITESDCNDSRGSAYVKMKIKELAEILGCSTVEDATKRINTLVSSIGLSQNLSQLGITKNSRGVILSNVNLQRVKNNPRNLDEQSLKRVLGSIE